MYREGKVNDRSPLRKRYYVALRRKYKYFISENIGLQRVYKLIMVARLTLCLDKLEKRVVNAVVCEIGQAFEHGKYLLQCRKRCFGACLHLLACIKLEIVLGKLVNEINLRRDICKLSLGTYFAQAAELLSQEDLPNPEILSLTLNCLHMLTEDIPEEKVKAVFELRIASLAGFLPDLSGCHGCGREEGVLFDISDGCLECPSCRNGFSGGIRMPVSAGTLDAMRYIISCDSKRLFSFALGQDNLRQLSQITEAYLTTQLERGFSTLDFYKSLFI